MVLPLEPAIPAASAAASPRGWGAQCALRATTVPAHRLALSISVPSFGMRAEPPLAGSFCANRAGLAASSPQAAADYPEPAGRRTQWARTETFARSAGSQISLNRESSCDGAQEFVCIAPCSSSAFIAPSSSSLCAPLWMTARWLQGCPLAGHILAKCVGKCIVRSHSGRFDHFSVRVSTQTKHSFALLQPVALDLCRPAGQPKAVAK